MRVLGEQVIACHDLVMGWPHRAFDSLFSLGSQVHKMIVYWQGLLACIVH